MPPEPRVLADECVHREIIARLRATGFVVDAVAEGHASLADEHVLALAVATGAVLLTNDRDYGELVFRDRSPPPSCILYVRACTQPPREVAARLIQLLAAGELYGSLIVIDDAEVRRRPFPRGT